MFCTCLQSRYSKSVESVVSALVDDTVSLNKRVGGMEGLVSRQQGQLQDTKEALLRCGSVHIKMKSCRMMTTVAYLYTTAATASL
jgi:hypothetical protein